MPDSTNVTTTAGLAETDHLQTRCSHCDTVFEVPQELLSSNDTRVRCGECLSIFDAVANLCGIDDADLETGLAVDEVVPTKDTPPTDTPARETLAVDTPAIDTSGPVKHESVTHEGDEIQAVSDHEHADVDVLDQTHTTDSDFDLYSGEARLPEVSFYDQTHNVEALRFDEPDGDETFTDVLDMTIDASELADQVDTRSYGRPSVMLDSNVGFVSEGNEPDPLNFQYRDTAPTSAEPRDAIDAARKNKSPDVVNQNKSEARSRVGVTKQPWVLPVLLGLIVVTMVGALLAHRHREAIVQNPVYRPVLNSVCAVLQCTLEPLVDLDALRPLKRSMFSHPTLDKSLLIDFAFQNDAPFDQPYPDLEVVMSDLTGQVVERTVFSPAQYVQGWSSDVMMESGKRIDLSLQVDDPGQSATSFIVTFR